MSNSINSKTLIILANGLLVTGQVSATTLEQALVQAWQSNPGLQSERANLAAAAENVGQTKGGYYPQVKVFGGVGTAHQDVTTTFFPISAIALNTRSIGLEVDQALYAGGRLDAATDVAESLRAAEEARLHSVEQDVLLDAAQAYMDVLQSQAVLRLETSDAQVLQQALEQAQASFDNGEVTHTDVDQAKARLAGAQAVSIQAQGALASAQAQYERVIGTVPDSLTQPESLSGLPATQQDALVLANRNYAVVAAHYASSAAHGNVEIAESALRPSLELTGQVSKATQPAWPFDRFDTRSIMLQFSMPLYTGGSLNSQVRAAEHQAESRELQASDAERSARDQVIRAWQAFQTAQAGLAAIQVQITAAQSAYDGVRAEHKEGERTTLDVLNAEQELLDAQVNQVRAERDEIVAEYALRAAVGALTAADLKLPVTAASSGD